VARWVVLVRRQNGGRFQMSVLNVEESTFLQYVCGGFAWQNLSAATFIYYVALSSLFAVLIIGM
jgi:hypothetical protein